MTESTTAAVDVAARDKAFVIIVNGERHTVESKEVSYEQVIEMAYPTSPEPDTRYTVTYRKAKGRIQEGSLAPGQLVEVKKEGTIFNVKTTGKS